MKTGNACRLVFSGGEVAFGALARDAVLTPTPERKVEYLMLVAFLLCG